MRPIYIQNTIIWCIFVMYSFTFYDVEYINHDVDYINYNVRHTNYDVKHKRYNDS